MKWAIEDIESKLDRLEKRIAALEDATEMFAESTVPYRIGLGDKVQISTVVALLVEHLRLKIIAIRPTGQSVKLMPKGVDRA